MRFNLLGFAGATFALVLSGCVPSKMGPTVQVMPPPGKPFDVFAADEAACQQYADGQIAGARNEANQQAVGAALLGTALGAGLGAAGGNAGFGAAAGSVAGTATGGAMNQQATGTIQQRYDIAYSQCMYSKNNIVPGFEPPPAPVPPPIVLAPPRPRFDPALVSEIQSQLARLGLYGGAPDGAFGPRTRGAISDFEKTKGLAVDGIPTPALLDQLKKS